MPTDRADLSVTLMLKVKNGDEAAFALLYDEHHRRVLNFFYGLSTDSHLANDLCQETFLRIWKFRTRYAATGYFPAYLLTFARFVWLEYCRERAKRNRLGGAFWTTNGLDQVAAKASARPDTATARSELGSHIRRALSKLPDEQRMVFVLQVVDGLSTEETASVMQCPINTVRSRKILAVRKLRASLQKARVYSKRGDSGP